MKPNPLFDPNNDDQEARYIHEYVREHYLTTTDVDMLAHLRLTYPSVLFSDLFVGKLRKKLGLKRPSLYDPDNEDAKYIHDYVRKHYRTRPDTEILARLRLRFPCTEFSDFFVGTLREKLGLKRTEEDQRKVMDRLVKTGVKKKAIEKGYKNSRAKKPQVRQRTMNGKKDWYIWLGPRKFKKYAIWLWEQEHGPFTNATFTATWIDPEGPLTIENVKKVYRDVKAIPIGTITTWLHEGKYREVIKLGEGKYELYLTYLWRQHYGEIPPGKHVAKINPDLPTTIENLHLTSSDFLEKGVKNLDDWYIEATLRNMNRGLSPETLQILTSSKENIALQRKKIELAREIKAEIKALSNEQSTTRDTTNSSVEGTPTQDEEL
jgi:hypothetical protein